MSKSFYYLAHRIAERPVLFAAIPALLMVSPLGVPHSILSGLTLRCLCPINPSTHADPLLHPGHARH
jgi:hypothetical protein